MKLDLKYSFLIVLFTLLTFYGRTSRIDRGYQALYSYDYFKAKKLFTKALKYNTASAAQGLAIIFYRTDNPFHSNDSALAYINLANEKFFVTNQKKRDLYAKYGFTEDSISNMRQLISQRFFELARKEGTVSSLGAFIEEHTWYTGRDNAIAIRDSLAFFNAVGSNSSEAYKRYMDQYPTSEFHSLAVENYNTTLYAEITEDRSLGSYETFIQSYPGSPMAVYADEEIYNIVTAPNTEEAFYQFVSKYPKNHLNKKGWGELYQSYLSDYSKERMKDFLVKYPECPISQDINRDILLADSLYLPYSVEGEYGYMNNDGFEVIPASFKYAGFFKEGLASIQNGSGVGCINKEGEVQIEARYDVVSEFEQGLAMVESNDKLGLIDRNGRAILELKFEDIGSLKDELVYASLNEKYGYYDKSGRLRIPHMFDDAYDFDHGVAKVSFEGKEAFIDTFGAFIVSPAYESISNFNDTLYLFEEDGVVGIMNQKCQIYKEPQFTQVGQFVDGLAIAELDENEELVYLNGKGDIKIKNELSTYPNYLLKGEFHNGIAIAMKNGKYGKIDTAGKFVVPAKYENIGMGNGIFPIQKSNLWGLMNNAGAVLIKPTYDALTVIGKNHVIATLNDTTGMIGPGGNILIPFAFNSIEPLMDDVFIASSDTGSFLFIGKEKMLDQAYDRIGIYNEDYLYLVKGGSVSYFDMIRKKVIEYNGRE